MTEFQLIEHMWDPLQELKPEELEPAPPICWRCFKGVNKGKLICPCKCTNYTQFIHIDCLEIQAKTRDVRSCPFCGIGYPLEIRRKSLLEYCRDRNTLLRLFRKVYGPLFKILGVIFFNLSLIGPIVYLTVSYGTWGFILIFSICLCIFLYSIYKTGPMIIGWSRSIYEFYHQWHKGTQELKLIKQNYVSIQETKV